MYCNGDLFSKALNSMHLTVTIGLFNITLYLTAVH